MMEQESEMPESFLICSTGVSYWLEPGFKVDWKCVLKCKADGPNEKS